MSAQPAQTKVLCSIAVAAAITSGGGCVEDWSLPRKDAGALDDASIDDGDADLAAGDDSATSAPDGALRCDADDCESSVSHCSDEREVPPCTCSSAWTGAECDEPRGGAQAPRLSNLTLVGGVLWPTFDPETHDYYALLGIGQSSLIARATVADDAEAELMLDGVEFVEGQAERRGISILADEPVELIVRTPNGQSSSYHINAVRSVARRTSRVSSDATTQFGGTNLLEVMSKFYPRVGAVALDGNLLAVGSPGRAFVSFYSRALGVWSDVAGGSFATDYSPQPNEVSDFGTAIDISDEWLVIGAPHYTTNEQGVAFTGGAYAIARREIGSGGRPAMTPLRRAAPGTSDYFGDAVAVDGNTIVVSASGEPAAPPTDALGAVYVYRFDGRKWIMSQRLVSGDPASATFGSRLALEGGVLAVVDDVIVTGGMNGDAAHGTVSIFRDGPSGFALEHTLTGADRNHAGYFAGGVAISQGRIAVAERRWCLYVSCVGNAAIHVYEHIQGEWREAGGAELPTEFELSEPLDPGEFGTTGFAFEGRTIVVAAEGEGSGLTGLRGPDAAPNTNTATRLGSLFIFDETEAGWRLRARLGPENTTPDPIAGGFGRNLALQGSTLAVASTYAGPEQDSETVRQGAVHIYGRDCARAPAGAEPATDGCPR